MEWLTKLFGGTGSINIISLYDILQSFGRSGLFRSFGKPPNDGKGSAPAPDGSNKSIQADASGRGFADEVLLLTALTELVDMSGTRVRDRPMTSADFEVFLAILKLLNESDRTKAADILTHIIGFKGATETTKVPMDTREVGKVPNRKTETVYAEYQRDINPTGAKILVLFGTLGAKRSIELLTSSHILDNLEDKAMTGAKKAAIELAALQKAGDTGAHIGMAFHKLGYSPTLLRQVLDAPALKKKRAAIDAEVDTVRKAALHEEYQALVIKKTRAILKVELAKTPQAGLSTKTITIKGRHIPLPVIRTGWSTASTIIRIGVPALIVAFLIFLSRQ